MTNDNFKLKVTILLLIGVVISLLLINIDLYNKTKSYDAAIGVVASKEEQDHTEVLGCEVDYVKYYFQDGNIVDSESECK